MLFRSEAERTLRENVRVFDDVTLRPRGAVAVPAIDLRTTVLGQSFDLPFLLAPIGSSRMFYPRAETHAAAAAGAAGTGYILSTLSGCALEDVKAATRGPAWYQVYLVGGREIAERAIARAKAAGFSALVVTVDSAAVPSRENNLRTGYRTPLRPNLSLLLDGLTHPAWACGVFLRTFLNHGMPHFENADAARVAARALHMLGPDAELRDLIQDVFVAAIDSIERLLEPNALRSWLDADAISACGIDPGVRPETLAPAEFGRLAAAVVNG